MSNRILDNLKVRISQLPPLDLKFNHMTMTEYEILVATIEKLNELVDLSNLTQTEFAEIKTWITNQLKDFSIEQLNIWLTEGTLETLINQTLLETKADKTSITNLENQLNSKSSIEYVDSKLTEKADVTSLNTKADKTSLTILQNQLINKPSTQYVNSKLDEKVNISTFEQTINSIPTASPKGTFNTLNDVKLAFPNGNQNIYITLDNGHWVYYNAEWLSGGIYQSSGISDNSITIEKISDNFLFKNLFNKNDVTQGHFVDNTTGTIAIATGYYASGFIKLEQGVFYTKNKEHQLAFYDVNKVYVSGLGDGTYTFKLPVNAVYVRLTITEDDLDSYQLEKGETITNTTEYQRVLPLTLIPRVDNVYNVAKVGGNFKSINDGLYYMSLIKPIHDVTFRINTGIYNEVITLMKGDCKVSLVGTNKRDCIIIDKTGDYYNSPLQPAGRNYFSNLTFIANYDDVASPPFPSSYAVHSDYNFSGEMVFENCDFKSYQNSALGVGMFGNQTMIFKNCNFYNDSVYDGGAIYFHNAVNSGVLNQRILFINCEFTSKNGHAISIDEANIGSGDSLGNDCEVTFINCNAYSETLGLECFKTNGLPSGPNSLVGSIRLSPRSSGNNLSVLNYAI